MANDKTQVISRRLDAPTTPYILGLCRLTGIRLHGKMQRSSYGFTALCMSHCRRSKQECINTLRILWFVTITV